MEETNQSFSPTRTPSRVSLRSISRSTSRLSSCYSEPSRPSCIARRKLTWIMLQGRLVGVDGATSARAVGPGLTRNEAMAWELFSPLHRVLLVALVAAATAKFRASQKIKELEQSVDLRDRALEAMQLKLDSLCDEINAIQEAAAKPGKTETQHDYSLTNLVEQEERRMSDLSDFCWSIASSFDNQLSSISSEQELYDLQKACEEKDATIKELLSTVQASKIADTKRITELENLVKRKNLVISKLTKDIAILKQTVLDITRSRRASSALCFGSTEGETPVMVNNILFDMSNLSSSSSDTESPCASKEHLLEGSSGSALSQEPLNRKKENSKHMLSKKIEISPEKNIKKKTEITGLVRPRQLISSSGSFKRTRRATLHESKAVPQRRWL
ncbi:inactive rhomboid protein [Rhynchospora pubera]|uniref:Inactive rhomboid protein n=1 Tax=Rhynchospora pubera TaxID=906938 RepID=A0AAV8CVM9_9POAL|nr:inactive rhomboid protein [Rhynchospora pubera]